MRKTLWLMSVLLIAGCGGDGEGPGAVGALEDPDFEAACALVPGCADPPRFAAPAARETIWRVLVVRQSDGEIRIAKVEAIEVPEGNGVPVGPLAGTHVLVGVDGSGEPVDGQRLQFPTVLTVEFAGGGASSSAEDAREIDLSGRTVDTIGYVRALPSIDTLEVRDAANAVVASAQARSTEARSGQVPELRLAGVAFAHAEPSSPWPYANNLPPYCSHIRVLEGEADRSISYGLESLLAEYDLPAGSAIVAPQATQRALVYGILRRMTPLLCQSVSRIAFVELPEDASLVGAVSSSMGDLVMLHMPYFAESRLTEGGDSEWLRQDLMRTVAHEAGHSALVLLGAQADVEGEEGDWELGARTLASETIDKVRMRKGVWKEWQRTHFSFVPHDWASVYQADGWRDAFGWGPAGVTDSGFMSAYGTKSISEDFAEMVGWSYTKGLFPDIDFSWWSIQDAACQEMRQYTEESVPARFSAVYTKLKFVQDLGLVAEEDVEECMGPGVGLPDRVSGFHFWHAGNKLRTFGNNMNASIGTTSGGNRVFEIRAEGEAAFGDGTYPATLALRLDLESRGEPLDELSWPRGVYELGLFGDNNLRLRLDGAAAGDFDVKDGFVLVAEASKDRIAGSVFITVGFRIHAPLPVPQTWDPPLIIRFLMQN